MNKQKQFFVIGFIVIAMLVYLSVDAHEVVHKQIYERYSIDSEINWFCESNTAGSVNNLAIACTVPDFEQLSKLSPEIRNTIYSLHSAHESVSYQQQIYGLGFVGLLFFIGLIWLSDKK